MPADDELFTEEDIKGGDDEAAGEGAPPPKKGGDDESALLAEASAAAAEHGLMVPDDAADCEEWVQHFITAAKTHGATKDKVKSEDEETTPEDDMAGAAPEPQMVAMSLRVQKLEAELGARKAADVLGDIKFIRETTPWALPEKEANAYRDRVQTKQLSLVNDETAMSLDLARIDALKRAAEGYARKAGLLTQQTQMSAAPEAVPHPAGSWDEDVAKGSQEVLDEMMKLGNLQPVTNGKK